MSKPYPFVRPGAVRPEELVWGYDGEQFDPTRRVSVSPWEMLTRLHYLSPEAKGMLLLLFCKSWAKDRAVPLEILRLTDRLSRGAFKRVLAELVDAKLVRIIGDAAWPIGAFGADPDASSSPTIRSGRDMPSDWADIREAVFARDGYACFYCGSGANLHCDHVHPLALGGSHDFGNLVTACAPCNLSKGPKTLAEWRPDIAEALKNR